MPRATGDVAIAVLAKAPEPGLSKTRLVPALGPEGAAALQARLIARTLATAQAAGPVTLWATPGNHPFFQTVPAGITLRAQPDGHLGVRMLAAVTAAHGPVLVIGTDCPALTGEHLRAAAGFLRDGLDAVVIPAEDGGYVLIGMHAPHSDLFTHMEWSVPTVMADTRHRLTQAGLTWREPARLWDVDTPADLERLRREFPELL
jgi:rSAM/selenodomain-associated transferase 1